MKILLLEDDVILNEIIEEFLLSLNYDVITAFDGNIAEELIYEESFDLLLFDVNIPNITGFELLKNIRQNNINIPIIFITSRHTADDVKIGFNSGCDDYIKKPFELSELQLRIENIKRLKLLSKDEFEKSIEFKLNSKNILVTFHPVTLENSTAKEQFQQLLDAIDELEDTNIIFTKANSDTDGRVINQMIDEYVTKNFHKSVQFTSLGQLRYLSALQYVDAVVGNSSSGLAETPSFKIGTINIGDRQKGRIKASSVIDCEPNKDSILKSFEKLYSKEFQETLKTTINPYGDGCASKKIVEILKSVDLENILKKSFYDLRG